MSARAAAQGGGGLAPPSGGLARRREGRRPSRSPGYWRRKDGRAAPSPFATAIFPPEAHRAREAFPMVLRERPHARRRRADAGGEARPNRWQARSAEAGGSASR